MRKVRPGHSRRICSSFEEDPVPGIIGASVSAGYRGAGRGMCVRLTQVEKYGWLARKKRGRMTHGWPGSPRSSGGQSMLSSCSLPRPSAPFSLRTPGSRDPARFSALSCPWVPRRGRRPHPRLPRPDLAPHPRPPGPRGHPLSLRHVGSSCSMIQLMLESVLLTALDEFRWPTTGEFEVSASLSLIPGSECEVSPPRRGRKKRCTACGLEAVTWWGKLQDPSPRSKGCVPVLPPAGKSATNRATNNDATHILKLNPTFCPVGARTVLLHEAPFLNLRPSARYRKSTALFVDFSSKPLLFFNGFR
eukprot:1318449-Rhodomonas_salina.2